VKKQLALELLDFINVSPTAYHATNTVKQYVEKRGFKKIKENEK